MVVAEPDALSTATENGYGKRTPMSDYPIKGRGGQGVLDIKTTDRNGEVVQAFHRQDDEIMFISEKGMVVRLAVADVSSIGRNTQGVRLGLKDEDRLVAVEIVRGEDLARSTRGTRTLGRREGAGEASKQGCSGRRRRGARRTPTTRRSDR